MRCAGLAFLMLVLAVGLTGCAAGGKVLYRVNCGDTKEYVDQAGDKWLPDQDFKEGAQYGAVGGLTITRTGLTVGCPRAPHVFITEHYSMSKYQFAVPNGKCAVRLYFCETYSGITKAGERVFTVKVQGKEALKDLDVLKEAGGFAKPLVKDVRDVAVTDGKLVIEFVPKVQNPEINGIEILQ